jgi:hypothetical protein
VSVGTTLRAAWLQCLGSFSAHPRARRFLAGVPLLILGSCISSACPEFSEAQRLSPASNRPSEFDYVVLASIADSSYPLGMSSYESAEDGRASAMARLVSLNHITHIL